MAKAGQQWTEQEFAGLDLGDARLNRRAKILVERLCSEGVVARQREVE
ncbi:transposase [Burkholderia ubonensis]|nr:transposase [Burkholderia ubonensis]